MGGEETHSPQQAGDSRKPEIRDGNDNDPVIEKALEDLAKAGKKIEELIEYYI